MINDIPLTHLYIKRHKSGLCYFGKTCRDPHTYMGSGTRWRNHLRKHGNDVETEVVGSFTSSEEISKVAIQFSIDNNIVESQLWANCRIENGLDGGSNGPHSQETKKLISQQKKGKPKSPETRQRMKEAWERRRQQNPPKTKKPLTPEQRALIRIEAGKKISLALTGKNRKPYTPETRQKLREKQLGKIMTIETRQKMSQIHKGKPKSTEHLQKISAALRGRQFTEEAKQKMSQSAKTRTKRTDFTKNSLAMKGRVWWNNGTEQKREKECPGVGWIRGQLLSKKPNAK